MTQFIRLTTAADPKPALINVAKISRIEPNGGCTTISLTNGNEIVVREPFDVIEANLRLMAHIAEMEATA
jgi:uncharacterized protein YlzI (FlbEa/FlbD family)